jgi:hypothetical protein
VEVDHKLLTDSLAPPTDELLRHWSLTIEDLRFVSSISTLPNLRVWVGLQICFLKKKGALARYPSDFPADAIPWMNRQFSISPLSHLQPPHRPATWTQQREALITYLGWREFEACEQDILDFIHAHVLNGKSRTEIINDLPKFLHRSRIVKPASQAELERHAGHLIERSTLDLEILISRSLGAELCTQLETMVFPGFYRATS